MNEEIYIYLKSKYENVIYYICKYICQEKNSTSYTTYNEVNEDHILNSIQYNYKYYEIIHIIEIFNINKKYTDQLEEILVGENNDSTISFKDILNEWVFYNIITKEQCEELKEKIIKQLTEDMIKINENLFLEEEK